MKSYPSISSSVGQKFTEFNAHVFSKIDGSNLRFEWSKKTGWYKQGTRHRLFDASDPVFGCAIDLFRKDWAAPLEQIFKEQRYESAIAFLEFHGPKSIAGTHFPDDPKTLTLFDVAPYKKGILGPKEFLELFGNLQIAPYLGEIHWTRAFVSLVREGKIEGMPFEGVVGKSGTGHHLVMAKAKTQAWIDAVLKHYGAEEGAKIIAS